MFKNIKDSTLLYTTSILCKKNELIFHGMEEVASQ